jgi:hypothetical protein
LDVKQIADESKAVVEEIERKKKIADMIIKMVKRLLAFTFVTIIFE